MEGNALLSFHKESSSLCGMILKKKDRVQMNYWAIYEGATALVGCIIDKLTIFYDLVYLLISLIVYTTQCTTMAVKYLKYLEPQFWVILNTD